MRCRLAFHAVFPDRVAEQKKEAETAEETAAAAMAVGAMAAVMMAAETVAAETVEGRLVEQMGEEAGGQGGQRGKGGWR